MGDRSGRLNSTRFRVDHVASDHVAWYLLYVKCLCVLSCDVSPVVEIWIILSGMFRTLDNKKYKEKKK